MRNSHFVPDDFKIPQILEASEFRLRILTIDDVEKDYDAVITSVDHLKGIFGPENKWPKGLTIEQDLIDLGWHQKEFQMRSSFAYTVMSLDESECLGCMYIYPMDDTKYDAKVFLWVRKSAIHLDSVLYKAVQVWLNEEWPFKKVTYPGRN